MVFPESPAPHLRMKSVESEKAISLLMAGAACRARTRAPPGRATAPRGATENCRLGSQVKNQLAILNLTQN